MSSDNHNRDIESVDELVGRYKLIQASENPTAAQVRERNEVLSQLLVQFDSYFCKYENILHGGEINLKNKDTYRFLALFLSGKDKNLRSLGAVRQQMVRIMQHYERGDIRNELVLIFIKIIDGYKVVHKDGYERPVDFIHYFTKVFRWRVKDWFNRLANQPLLNASLSLDQGFEDDEGNSSETSALMVKESLEVYSLEAETADQRLDLEQLDLSWVVGTKDPLFKELSRYDRYLLYLHYGLGHSVQGIAEQFGRDKDTIWRHLGQILEGLREKTGVDAEGEEEDPSRFRGSGIGSSRGLGSFPSRRTGGA